MLHQLRAHLLGDAGHLVEFSGATEYIQCQSCCVRILRCAAERRSRPTVGDLGARQPISDGFAGGT
jgi:hypothetical protein